MVERPSEEFFQAVGGQEHAPASEIPHRRGANGLAESKSEDGARHARHALRSDCSVQPYPGSLCMMVMARLIWLSDKAESQPRTAVVASAK